MQTDIFRMPADEILTPKKLAEFITKNETITKQRYKKLWNAYINKYDIFTKKRKAAFKPDNRIAVNFAEYIVSVFEGFFMGNPVKITSDEADISEYINLFDSENDMDDKNAELSTIVSIFGRGYEMYYVDDEAELRTACLNPMEAFLIYDEAITPHPLFFVRYFVDSHGVKRGSISDNHTVSYFEYSPDIHYIPDSEQTHGFSYVPAVEYTMNTSRHGIFESVLSLINAYNQAISEKTNDVDYFADAYLKILGATLDGKAIQFMRDNRVINLEGEGAKDIIVDFLQKPNGDTTQENLLDRVERLIFVTAMVCNISDENFATSSGIALKYKLLPMINLAKVKERKFTGGFNKRYKIICSNPLCPLEEDDWSKITYSFSYNLPANISDEADTAAKLSGITSKKTQLSVLSIVDDVDKELERIDEEDQESLTDYETERLGHDETNNEANRTSEEETD